MLGDSKIETKEMTLDFSISAFGAGRMALYESIGVVFAYWIVHQFVSTEYAESKPLSLLLYLLPLFLVWRLFKRLRKLVLGEKFHFDKQLNELTVNGIRKTRLDNIEAVEINYNFKNDSDDKYLELKLRNSGSIRIRDFGSKNALINDGRQIAEFLKVKMLDNNPNGKELLRGEQDVEPASISI